MRRMLGLILIVFLADAYGQTNFSKYYNSSSFAVPTPFDHLDIDFKWTLHGKAQVFMNEGLNDYGERNLDQAKLNFDKVLEMDSSFWPAYYYRGVCFKNRAEFDLAEDDLHRVIGLNPQSIEARLELGELYFIKGNPEIARKFYEEALQINSDGYFAHYFLATLALNSGDDKDADLEYQHCTRIGPQHPEPYLMRGIILSNAKDALGSMNFFNQAIGADSTFGPAYFWRGLQYIASGENEKALLDWNRLARMSPGQPFYTVMRGCLLIELGRYSEAFQDFRVFIGSRMRADEYSGRETVFDKHADLQVAASYMIRKGYGLKEESFDLLKKAFCMWIAKREDVAVRTINEALDIEESSTAYLLRGMIFNQIKEFQQAEWSLSKALILDPDIFEAYEKRGLYRYNIRDWQGAISDVEQMKRLKPGTNSLNRFSGLLKSNVNDYSGCVADLSGYFRAEIPDKEVWETLVYCYQKVVGATAIASASKELMSIYQKFPEDKGTPIQLCNKLIDINDLASAEKVLFGIKQDFADQAFLNGKSTNKVQIANAYYLESRILEIKGDNSRALQAVDEAIARDKEDPEKYFLRMRLHLKMNNIESAKKDLAVLKKMKFTSAKEYYQAYQNSANSGHR